MEKKQHKMSGDVRAPGRDGLKIVANRVIDFVFFWAPSANNLF